MLNIKILLRMKTEFYYIDSDSFEKNNCPGSLSFTGFSGYLMRYSIGKDNYLHVSRRKMRFAVELAMFKNQNAAEACVFWPRGLFDGLHYWKDIFICPDRKGGDNQWTN